MAARVEQFEPPADGDDEYYCDEEYYEVACVKHKHAMRRLREEIRRERTLAREPMADGERDGDEVPGGEKFAIAGSLRAAGHQGSLCEDAGLHPVGAGGAI